MNVLRPAFAEQLKQELGNSYFSVIMDESTDIGQDKMMAYCIRYYNITLKKIVVDFLGFQLVSSATGEILYENFFKFFEDAGIDLNKMIAIATDGASNLCGKNNSLFSRLKDKFPKLVLLKCVCHSLAKCAQNATAQLPSSLEFLLRETRNWFSHSPLRTMLYQNFAKSLSGKKPPKLVTMAPTRWLSFNTAVRQNIDQWDELKQHFGNIVQEAEKDRNKSCVIARTLSIMYNDNANLLYMLCVSSVLDEVNNVNLVFQSNDVDIVSAYNDLYLLVATCARRIFKPAYLKVRDKNLDVIERKSEELKLIKTAVENADKEFNNSMLSSEDIDFGYKFEEYLSNHSIKSEELVIIKGKCRAFLLKLISELIERIPPNFAIIQKIQYFSASVFLESTNKVSHNMLPWDLVPVDWDKEKIKTQWERLSSLKKEDIYGLREDVPMTAINIVDFWTRVSEMKNALNDYCFKELSEFALLCLSLPISNGVVERVFSIMNCVKTKLRNRMGTVMLNSIVFIRLFGHVRNFCCSDFVPSPRMYKLHNSSMYEYKTEDSIISLQSNDNDSDNQELKLFYEALVDELEDDIDNNIITLYAGEDILFSS